MKKLLSFFILLLTINTNLFSQDYKAMMEDNSINFYTVCKAADKYFEGIDKNKKGSGYKPYQRWKNANEYKYFPSGRRDNVSPDFAAKSYQMFRKKNPLSSRARTGDLFNNGWNELGPSTITDITGHYSAGLGRVEDHYVDPNDANKMYLGSRSGGFWKSSDGGTTWQGGSTDFLPASGVNAIAVSPTNPDSVLINIRNASNGYSHGIYRSTDGGTTWVLSNFSPVNVGFGGLGSNFKIYKIAYHPTVSNLIFIGTSKGIYRSDDNLATWTRLINTGDVVDIAFHPTDPNMIYLYENYYWGANKNYVMRSIDGGLSYSQSTLIVGNNGNRSGHLSVSNPCEDCLYFASGNGIWKSTDKGMNFTFISNPPQGAGGFAVNDSDTTKMIYGYLDIVASSDEGQNFTQVTSWSLGSAIHGTGNFQTRYNNSTAYVHADLRIAKSVNGVFYVGTDGFFCKSVDNGITWEILSRAVGIRENYKLGVSQSNHFRSISGSQDNGTSIKHKDKWVEFYGADGMEAIIHPLNDDLMIGSLQNGGRRKTKDGGFSQGAATPPNNGSAAWEAPIAYDPNKQMRVYDFRDTIYVSEDFGSTWTYRGVPNTFTGTIRQAAIAENNSNIIVISQGNKIEKSTDAGANFVSIKGTLPNSSIQDIAFDPNDDEVIIVVYGAWQNDNNKIFITTDGGTTWANITYNLGNIPMHTVVIDHTNASNIYLGAEMGVYTKSMLDNTWTLYNTQLPNTTVQELEIVYGSNTLKAATWGRGMWEYSLVNRNSYPSIMTSKISDQPTNSLPKEGVAQFITSTVSYDNSLTSVFVKWSANDISLGNTIAMTNTADSTWKSQAAIPTFSSGTKIYFKVFAVGTSSDTTETYRFMYEVRPFEYCIASSSGTTSDYINSISLNGMQNTSGKDNYTYYSDSVIYLNTGDTYTLTIQLQNAFASDLAGAWIDFNKNSLFDASENIPMSAYNASNQSFGTFTVPLDAVLNDTLRLRTRNEYWGSTISPCGNNTGEVEDYPILVQSIVIPCTAATAPVGVSNTWTGCTNTDWNTASNWSTGLVPTASDVIYVPKNTNNNLIITQTVTCAKLVVQIGAKCTIDYNSGGKLWIKF